MSKSQLNAFMVKVGANAGLKTKVDAASSADDVVALALEEGHQFSAATWTRLQRG
ncbi:MAG: Nif11-like leader peptide family natural product precursor [Cyanobium sp. LacPavin_0920_WC12_MAG_62_9]|jgi:predicted ribosomally synthesized peptide with nif11-like leader|nr:Nif11-like leader peptide family natural product precursor [Cyanobium sp. LacPavin_0920_WC12_MAG_62_9]